MSSVEMSVSNLHLVVGGVLGCTAWCLYRFLMMPFKLPPLPGPYTCIGVQLVRLASIRCKVFYPADAKKLLEAKSKLASYLSHPSRFAVPRAFARFSNIPLTFVLDWIAFKKYHDVYENAPILELEGGKKYPVVIYMHGLSGNADVYSAMCRDLASRGYVVVATEHADKSACVTVDAGGKDILYEFPPKKTDPSQPDRVIAVPFRQPKLKKRTQEVEHVIDALCDLDGHLDGICAPEGPLAVSIKRQLDMHTLALAGHSFGGAAAIYASGVIAEKKTDKKYTLKCVLLHDPWMDCLTEEQIDAGMQLPTLIVICGKWLYWKAHLPFQLRFFQACLKRNTHTHTHTTFAAIKESGHVNFSDACLWGPKSFLQYTGQAGAINRYRFFDVCGKINAAFLERELHNGGGFSYSDIEKSIGETDRPLLVDVSKFDPAVEWKSRKLSIEQEKRTETGARAVSSMSIHPHINEEGDIMTSDHETANGNGNGNGNAETAVGGGEDGGEGVRQRKAKL